MRPVAQGFIHHYRTAWPLLVMVAIVAAINVVRGPRWLWWVQMALLVSLFAWPIWDSIRRKNDRSTLE